MSVRMLILICIAYMHYSAIPEHYCAATTAAFVLSSIACTTCSEIGRPLEPVITTTFALFGHLAGTALRRVLLASFCEQQVRWRAVH